MGKPPLITSQFLTSVIITIVVTVFAGMVSIEWFQSPEIVVFGAGYLAGHVSTKVFDHYAEAEEELYG